MQLFTAAQLVANFGAKCLIYSGPGMAKTPMCATAPLPVMCSAESGLLSLRNDTRMKVALCQSAQTLDEFWRWLFTSAESRLFDTVCLDSGPEMAEIYLAHERSLTTNLQRAYGQMQDRVMHIMNGLNRMPYKHVVILSKEAILEIDGITSRAPIFPGKALNVSIPHLFDEILHVEFTTGQDGKQTRMLRTRNTLGVRARDRSGTLNEYEPCNLQLLFNKILAGVQVPQ